MKEFVFENGPRVVFCLSEGSDISPDNVMVAIGGKSTNTNSADKIHFADYVYHAAVSWKMGEGNLFKCILMILLERIFDAPDKHEGLDEILDNEDNGAEYKNAFDEEDISRDFDGPVQNLVAQPCIKEECNNDTLDLTGDHVSASYSKDSQPVFTKATMCGKDLEVGSQKIKDYKEKSRKA